MVKDGYGHEISRAQRVRRLRFNNLQLQTKPHGEFTYKVQVSHHKVQVAGI